MPGRIRKANATDANMSPYDARAWQEIQDWKQRRLAVEPRFGVPGPWQQRLSRAGALARQRFDALPGSERFEAKFGEALRGLTDFAVRTAAASVRRDKVMDGFTRRGYAVRELTDIRYLELSDLDDVRPRLDVGYIAASTVQGAATGLAGTGGVLLATGAGAASAGTAAAPGAATLVGVLAADAAAVMFASHRVVAHIAAYYGYDIDQPQERLFALGVIGMGTAAPGAKAAAYLDLNRVVHGLLRGHGWEQLSNSGVTRIVNQVYQLLGRRLTKRKLAQAVPVAGVVIGAGLNARMLARVADEANYLYRERFLREKYDLATDTELVASEGAETVGIAEIIDAEIVDAEIVDAEIVDTKPDEP